MDEGNHAGQQDKPASKGHRVRRSIVWLIVVGVFLVATSSAGTYYFIAKRQPAVPTELKNVRKSVNFPLYYPAELPPGFMLDKTSISSGSNAVVYSCTYDNGKKKVSISVQPKHDGFTTDDFNATTEFTTRIGRAYLVDLEDRTTAAVVADNSWLLINAPQTMPIEDMKHLIDSMRVVQ